MLMVVEQGSNTLANRGTADYLPGQGMTEDRYRSESQQRILKILLTLGGHEINGLSPGEISKSLNIQPAHITRDLANLKIAGIAESIPETGRWRLTPKVPQIAMAMLREIEKREGFISETKQRYTRDPK